MSSVTKRISEIKQPYGGYIRPSQFEGLVFRDRYSLHEQENVHPSIVGATVDYLTRFLVGEPVEKAFVIPLEGAYRAQALSNRKDFLEEALGFLSKIQDINTQSIINACKLVSFDVWARNPMAAMGLAKDANEINPDTATVDNILIMVHRAMFFWHVYGPVVKTEFTFEPDGYTQVVNSGDGDFLTPNGMWDFKVTKKAKPTSAHTLQLLMYWIMGKHSTQPIYDDIKTIGFFNPRLNVLHSMEVDNIPSEVIEEVEKEVICY